MLKHIILWRFQPALNEAQKQAETTRLQKAFSALQPLVPGLLCIEFGRNINPDNDYDAALFCLFTDDSALQAYQAHPAHLAVKNTLAACLCGRACVDYEM